MSTQANRKGILLAGGASSRLYPITFCTPKALLPVYDKPLIYYPLCTLMLAHIRDILIITTPDGQALFQKCLGDGSQFGLRLCYQIQTQPRGIADSFLIGESFINGSPCALVLSDNLFYGSSSTQLLQTVPKHGATIFTYPVTNPNQFGVVTLSADGKPLTLEEKPLVPKSNLAVTGCYFYDEQACHFAKQLTPSARGELEITDLNQLYLKNNTLHIQNIPADETWFDTGTPDSLAQATKWVQSTQRKQQKIIACPEDIAWQKGWLDRETLKQNIKRISHTAYGQYLKTALLDKP